MLAEVLNGVLRRRGIHYGWVIVALTFMTMLTTAGAMGLPGALLLPLHTRVRLEPRQHLLAPWRCGSRSTESWGRSRPSS